MEDNFVCPICNGETRALPSDSHVCMKCRFKNLGGFPELISEAEREMSSLTTHMAKLEMIQGKLAEKYMCHRCRQPITQANDANLCQRCTEEHDLQEIAKLSARIESAERTVGGLVKQMADMDILQSQYEIELNFELAAKNKTQLVEMKRSETLSRRMLNNLIEKRLKIEERMNSETATPETPPRPR